MRKIIILLSLFFTAIILFSCGGNTSKSKKDKDGNIIITVASRYGSDVPDEIYYRKKVEEFNDNNNGIKIEMDNIPSETSYLDKLRVSFANGDTPNVFIEYGGSRTLDYLEANALLNMEPHFEEDKDWYDTFYPSMFRELKYEGYQGLWGVPFKSYTILIYYNKDMFKKHDITVPESFNDLLAVCEKLKIAGIRPFQVAGKQLYRLGHFHNNLVIKSMGWEAALRLADRTLKYDSPEMIRTYQIIYDMNKKGYFGIDVLSTDYNTEKSMFASDKCAMRWDGSWFISELPGTDLYDKVGVMPFPYIDEKYRLQAQGGSSDMWFISTLNKTDEEIKASVEFVKYITSKDYYIGNNEVASVLYPVKFTPSPDTITNPILDELKYIVDEYTDMSTDIQNYDTNSYMLDTVRNALQGLFMGNTPNQCAEEIVTRMNEYNK